MSTSAQRAAKQYAQRMLLECSEYRSLLPPNRTPFGAGGVCRADGWDINPSFLHGDYALDDVVARWLGMLLLDTERTKVSALPGEAMQPAEEVSSSWLIDYLLHSQLSGVIGSSERFASGLENATLGPGNILANVNTGRNYLNAKVRDKTGQQLTDAAKHIESGHSKPIKVNGYMSLYNANADKKGPARPRLLIKNLPVQVVTPTLGEELMRVSRGGYNMQLRSMNKGTIEKASKLAAERHWSNRASYLNGRMGGGILTFGPSAALDIVSSIEMDVDGQKSVNWRKFTVASARSQSGNVAGTLGYAGFSAVAVFFGAAAAPVIIFGVTGAFLFQAIWGSFGGSDWAGEAVERVLDP